MPGSPETPPSDRSVCRDLCTSIRYAWCDGPFTAGAVGLRLRWALIAASFVAFMGSTAPDHPLGDAVFVTATVSAAIFVLAIGWNAGGEQPWWRPPHDPDDWNGR